jgi:hypothetical protein
MDNRVLISQQVCNVRADMVQSQWLSENSMDKYHMYIPTINWYEYRFGNDV